MRFHNVVLLVQVVAVVPSSYTTNVLPIWAHNVAQTLADKLEINLSMEYCVGSQFVFNGM